MTDEHLPTKEKATQAGICYECGSMFYVGDWVIVYIVGTTTVAAHAEHYGVKK